MKKISKYVLYDLLGSKYVLYGLLGSIVVFITLSMFNISEFVVGFFTCMGYYIPLTIEKYIK